MNRECPARTAVVRLLREARLNWRLARLGETLAALEPIVELDRDGVDLTANPARDSNGCTPGTRRTWARGAIRLATEAAYLLGDD